jgi:hypothetical protein
MGKEVGVFLFQEDLAPTNHNINNQDGDIAQGAPTRAQVGE